VQGKNLLSEVYVVVNRVMSGREALGVFSTAEMARKYMDRFASRREYLCQMERSFLRGYYQPPDHVFAAHIWDHLDDVHILEGLYSELSEAQRAAGPEGEIIEFSIDSPEEQQISMNE